MEERFREYYFTALRLGLLLCLDAYVIMTQIARTGASTQVLLLLALWTGCMAATELTEKRWLRALLFAAGIVLAAVLVRISDAAVLLVVYWCYELFVRCGARVFFYLIPLLFAGAVGRDMAQLVTAAFIGIVYWQHQYIVVPYERQMREDNRAEQKLKHRVNRAQELLQETVRQNKLEAENQLLEERAALAQTLHDKLGHNINGSVYQLEAVKLLMETQPQRAHAMVQAVIDQLRTGMDEIRAILRRERPEKYRLALLQLEKLCEDCRGMGVDAQLLTEGEMSDIPDEYLEIILDNAYEAVSNAMKYAGCSKIRIHIYVLNQMIRCTISDNGRGCVTFSDGMGISGMRQRMRRINGILDFETEAGFIINMLMPLQEVDRNGKNQGDYCG